MVSELDWRSSRLETCLCCGRVCLGKECLAYRRTASGPTACLLLVGLATVHFGLHSHDGDWHSDSLHTARNLNS